MWGVRGIVKEEEDWTLDTDVMQSSFVRLFTVESPIFPWDFRDSNASIELPPSLFVRASATWGECLNYRGGPSQVTLRSCLRLPTPAPARYFRHSPQVALALTNKDGGRWRQFNRSLRVSKIPRKNRSK